VVLGTADSKTYVERAGGTVLAVENAAEAMDVLLIGDDSGYPFLETVNAALTGLLRRMDAGVQVVCLLPNPDLIYPAGADAFGVTSGGIAAMFEAVLAQRYGEETPSFVRLGKPHAPLFMEGIARAGTRNVLMIGDTLETDILGASRVGIDSALVETGISRWRKRMDGESIQPTWRLAGLRPSDDSSR
jgi:ribonucleotide monophosphatase NagD (HAD superfamily)